MQEGHRAAVSPQRREHLLLALLLFNLSLEFLGGFVLTW